MKAERELLQKRIDDAESETFEIPYIEINIPFDQEKIHKLKENINQIKQQKKQQKTPHLIKDLTTLQKTLNNELSLLQHWKLYPPINNFIQHIHLFS